MFDSDKNDRRLLSLSLLSALPNTDVLEASSPVEVAHHISVGAVDALIADPNERFGEVCSLMSDIRLRYPASICWLFGNDKALPSMSDCIGHGIDGRSSKTSAGFLELPRLLTDKLRWFGDVRKRFNKDINAFFVNVFPGANCLISEQGDLLAVSADFEQIAEQPRFNLVGKPLASLWLDPAKRDEWQEKLKHSPRNWQFTSALRCAQASKPQIAMTLSAVDAEEDGAKAWAATLLDVTTLSQGTAESSHRQGEESELSVAALAHDLQAPLNSLGAQIKTMRGKLRDDAKAIAHVDEIEVLSERMQSMLDGIAAFADPDTDSAEREIVSLETILHAALENLESAIDESAATIEHDELPALAVSPAQMTQVFQNLISNAIKFCGNRIPRVRVYTEQSDNGIAIVFEDNGIGIEISQQDRIFEMFQRVHGDTSYPGVGAGLAICRRIVRAHGGELSVESNLGRGSRFRLEFRGPAVKQLSDGDKLHNLAG